jgi:hypothetical protein
VGSAAVQLRVEGGKGDRGGELEGPG